MQKTNRQGSKTSPLPQLEPDLAKLFDDLQQHGLYLPSQSPATEAARWAMYLAWPCVKPLIFTQDVRKQANEMLSSSALTCTPVLDLLILYKGPKTLSELGTTEC